MIHKARKLTNSSGGLADKVIKFILQSGLTFYSTKNTYSDIYLGVKDNQIYVGQNQINTSLPGSKNCSTSTQIISHEQVATGIAIVSDFQIVDA